MSAWSMVCPVISLPASKRVCKSAHVIWPGSPAVIGPVLTKKVACMPCADRIGAPLLNWSTVPSSNPIVTIVGVLAAAGGVHKAPLGSHVATAAAAAANVRILDRTRSRGAYVHSRFIASLPVRRAASPGRRLLGDDQRLRFRNCPYRESSAAAGPG